MRSKLKTENWKLKTVKRSFTLIELLIVIAIMSSNLFARAMSGVTGPRIKKLSSAFTLIELLIVIAIIAILIGVLVPSMSRSLSGNRLASDVEVLRAKIEETRLLAGSTQTIGESVRTELPNTDRVGYYGLYIPPSDIISDPNQQFYAIVRVSFPPTHVGTGYCNAALAASDALAGKGDCLVERINLTKNVTFTEISKYNPRYRIIGFRVPSQQTVELFCPESCGGPNIWQENPLGPKFDLGGPGPDHNYFKLKYNNKTATIKIEPYTGKLIVVYN